MEIRGPLGLTGQTSLLRGLQARGKPFLQKLRKRNTGQQRHQIDLYPLHRYAHTCTDTRTHTNTHKEKAQLPRNLDRSVIELKTWDAHTPPISKGPPQTLPHGFSSIQQVSTPPPNMQKLCQEDANYRSVFKDNTLARNMNLMEWTKANQTVGAATVVKNNTEPRQESV